MTFANAINNIALTTVNVVVINSSQTYTPPANLISAIFEIVGGGGGTGSAPTTNATQLSGGLPGGSGAYCRSVFQRASLLPNVSITIGSGGAGGAPGVNNGANGGSTSCAGLSLEAGGGGAGGVSLVGTTGETRIGGLAGLATSGTLQCRGTPGGMSFLESGNGLIVGLGGTSFFGGTPNLDATGTVGRNGSGGSGPFNGPSTATKAGRAGGDGLCVITEFLKL